MILLRICWSCIENPSDFSIASDSVCSAFLNCPQNHLMSFDTFIFIFFMLNDSAKIYKSKDFSKEVKYYYSFRAYINTEAISLVTSDLFFSPKYLVVSNILCTFVVTKNT